MFSKKVDIHASKKMLSFVQGISMNLEVIQHGISEEISLQNRIISATLLSLAGLGLLFLVGFTQGPQNALHNAAHDTRHVFTFPCH